MLLSGGPHPLLRVLFLAVTAVSVLLLIVSYYLSNGNVYILFSAAESNATLTLAEEPATLTQEHRQLVLKLACDATKSLRPKENLEYLIKNPHLLDHLIFNDKHKLIYCYIPKVACTQWKKLLGVLSGALPDVPLSEIPGSAGHERGVHRFLSELPAAAIRRRLTSYQAFLFVRHPLERLVSGYRNKFADQPGGYFPELFAAEIRARFGAGAANASAPVSFEQFARWVSERRPPNPRGARNEHWRPMAELCRPCSVPYAVVGRMESLQEDARLVLQRANVSSLAFPGGFRSRTGAVTADMLSTLPPDVLREVLRLYFQDFLLFGYEPHEVFARNRTAYQMTKIMLQSLFLES